MKRYLRLTLGLSVCFVTVYISGCAVSQSKASMSGQDIVNPTSLPVAKVRVLSAVGKIYPKSIRAVFVETGPKGRALAFVVVQDLNRAGLRVASSRQRADCVIRLDLGRSFSISQGAAKAGKPADSGLRKMVEGAEQVNTEILGQGRLRDFANWAVEATTPSTLTGAPPAAIAPAIALVGVRLNVEICQYYRGRVRHKLTGTMEASVAAPATMANGDVWGSLNKALADQVVGAVQ